MYKFLYIFTACNRIFFECLLNVATWDSIELNAARPTKINSLWDQSK